MTVRNWLMLAVLVVDAVVLAVVELLFLPLRFDGYLLPNILGGMPVPASALVAALTTPWLVGVAGRLSPKLLVAAAPLFGWIVAVAVFGMFGPGGDLVLVSDWRSLLLFACGALPSALVLGKVLATTLAPSG
jgi:acid phosphatase family membrane protein YuiD